MVWGPKDRPLPVHRGLYFGPKRYLFPPPSENYIFFPSPDMSFFDSHRGLFALILPYFAFILPFFFLFSHILSPFFLFPSPFFLFLLHFPPFSLCLFIFFPPNDIGWYFFPPCAEAAPPAGPRSRACPARTCPPSHVHSKFQLNRPKNRVHSDLKA